MGQNIWCLKRLQLAQFQLSDLNLPWRRCLRCLTGFGSLFKLIQCCALALLASTFWNFLTSLRLPWQKNFRKGLSYSSLPASSHKAKSHPSAWWSAPVPVLGTFQSLQLSCIMLPCIVPQFRTYVSIPFSLSDQNTPSFLTLPPSIQKKTIMSLSEHRAILCVWDYYVVNIDDSDIVQFRTWWHASMIGLISIAFVCFLYWAPLELRFLHSEKCCSSHQLAAGAFLLAHRLMCS